MFTFSIKTYSSKWRCELVLGKIELPTDIYCKLTKAWLWEMAFGAHQSTWITAWWQEEKQLGIHWFKKAFLIFVEVVLENVFCHWALLSIVFAIFEFEWLTEIIKSCLSCENVGHYFILIIIIIESHSFVWKPTEWARAGVESMFPSLRILVFNDDLAAFMVISFPWPTHTLLSVLLNSVSQLHNSQVWN